MNIKFLKSFLAFFAFMFALTNVQAQSVNDTMYVMKNGISIFSSPVADIDSIIFYAPAKTSNPTSSATPESEMAKYETSVDVGVIATSVGSDYTAQVIRLKIDSAADNSIAIKIVSAGMYFDKSADGKTLLLKSVPGSSSASDKIIVEFSKGNVVKLLNITANIYKSSELNSNQTFLLYGYDVINSAYINRDEIKLSAPIIDLNKANPAALIIQTDATKSTWDKATSNSVSEVYKTLSGGASAGVNAGLFSAKVSTEFSVSNGNKKTNFFSKARGVHQTKEEWLRNTDPAYLKDYFTSTFKTDIANMSAEQLIAKYGTHFIKRCYWGGTAEFNYSYSGTELTSANAVSAAVEASYGAVSGSVNIGREQERKELNENSKFYAKTVGGENTSIMGIDDFGAKYETWVNSIQNQPDICAIGNFNDCFIPLWDLVAQVDSSKAVAVENEFQLQLAERGSQLASFVYNYVVPEQTALQTVFEDEKTINDNGVLSNSYDVINFSDFGIDLAAAKEQGYKSLTFYIRLNVAEVNDGYQYIYMYSSPVADGKYDCGTPNSGTNRFEHTHGSKDSSWGIHEFKFENVDINRFTEGLFVIRYDASGDGGDDWKRGTGQVQITVNK
jgi:hypothetical protein